MRLHAVILILILGVIFIIPQISAKSIKVIDSILIKADSFKSANSDDIELYVNGIYMTQDTCIVSLSTGIFLKTMQSDEWIRFISSHKWTDTWWNDFQNANKYGYIYSPQYTRFLPNTRTLVVFDDWMGSTYHLDITDIKEVRSSFSDLLDSIAIVNNVKIYDNMILHNLIPVDHDTLLAISKLDGSNYKRLFTPPKKTMRFLDSVGADYYSYCTFKYDDSAIFFAFKYYNTIYELNLSGSIVDSIAITDSLFHLPEPPKSRIKSLAVLNDWLSNCTGIRNLCFAYPETIVMQFWEKEEANKKNAVRPIRTLFWNTDKTRLDIDIDRTWRLVQTLPDGRIIFVKYHQTNSRNDKAIVYITRIQP